MFESTTQVYTTWLLAEKRSSQVPEEHWWNTPCTDTGLGDAEVAFVPPSEASSNVGLWGANVLRHLRRKRWVPTVRKWLDDWVPWKNGWNPVDTGGLFKAKLYPKAPCIVINLFAKLSLSPWKSPAQICTNRSLTVHPWKMMVGRGCLSPPFWDGNHFRV